MTGYRAAERPEVWLPPATNRPSRAPELVRCFVPLIPFTGVAALSWWDAPVVAYVLASVGVVASVALFVHRAFIVSDVLRDADGGFRLRRGLRVTAFDRSDVASIEFAAGIRPSLTLRDGRRVRLAWSPALDELIHVAPATRERPPARIERRDYYREARLMASFVGAMSLLSAYARGLEVLWPWRMPVPSYAWLSSLAICWAAYRLLETYGRYTDVRFLDGRRARRRLGTVRA